MEGDETALDIGCGYGSSLPGLVGRAKTVVAMDLSRGMLRAVQRLAGPVVAVAQGDAGQLPVGDACLDVVLAAFMLYHVPDIDTAIAEARRALQPAGTSLVTLNGARDKCELREVWGTALKDVLGTAAEAPNWNSRANLDNIPTVLRRHFSEVTVPRPGRFRFPSPEPPLLWVDNLRAGTENDIIDADWARIRQGVRDAIERRIGQEGEFVVTKDSGVIAARSPVTN